MNLSYGLNVVFGFATVFVILTVIGYFFHYQDSRRLRILQSKTPHPTRGRFFERFIPFSQKEKYSKVTQEYETMGGSSSRLYRYRYLLISWGVGLVALVVFVVVNRYRFLPPIDLDPTELTALDNMHRVRRSVADQRLPILQDDLDLIRKQGMVLLQNSEEREENITDENKPIGEVAFDQWSRWLEYRKIPFNKCQPANLDSCLRRDAGKIWVVLPGRWSESWLNKLAQAGQSVILFGPPYQVYSDDGQFNYGPISFEKYRNSEGRVVAIREGGVATFGFDPGFLLHVYSLGGGYRATSPKAEAYSRLPEGVLGSSLDARIVAFLGEKGGRFLWFDFSPNSKDHEKLNVDSVHLNSVLASFFRFLRKEEATSIATWPAGKSWAGFIAQDTGAGFRNSTRVADLIEKKEAPITWFLDGAEAQLNRPILRRLSELGELGCMSDNGRSLTEGGVDEQVRRVARCNKILERVAGRKGLGLRPPEERFNEDTVDAASNNGLTFYFVGPVGTRSVPEMEREVRGNSKIVRFTRNVSDSYNLWSIRQLKGTESVARVRDEIAWVKSLGGLYTFSFHSWSMKGSDEIETLSAIIDELKSDTAWFATVGTVADWWVLRDRLLAGESVSSDEIARFKPTRLKLTKDGEILREPLQ